jgi:hypothetical protein
MIEYVTPALVYVLRSLGVRDRYLSVGSAYLIRCWDRGLCRRAEPYLQICQGDPRCEYIKNVVKKKDWAGALGLYAWYLKCTGRRAVKLLNVEGEAAAVDYTEDLMKRYPPPDLPC